MLKIRINTDALQPMLNWLRASKEQGLRDEDTLRRILKLEPYQIEFARYGSEGLPVCGISYEEAVDFFLHFDEKSFQNPRLQTKQPVFAAFYDHMEESLETLQLFSSLSQADCAVVETLLQNGLPQALLNEDLEITVLLVISIGNSFGWPYENYIDFDASNLELLADKDSLLHIIAHEIHHMFFEKLIPDECKPEEYFLLNFAFEGLAVHFTNNQAARWKTAKYPGNAYCMDTAGMALYESEFDELFARLRADYQASKAMTPEQVAALVGQHYEQFQYNSLKTGESIAISQYPTYYLGCYLFGLIDQVLGKERLFAALAHPEILAEAYNQAVRQAGHPAYQLPV